MVTPRYLRIAGVVIALLSTHVGSFVLACSCLPPGAAEVELGKAEAVLTAKVVASSRVERSLVVQLQVERVFKGLGDEGRVVARTAGSTAACGFPFHEGQSYLIYASKVGEETGGAPGGSLQVSLEVSLCSRTKPVAQAAEELASLEALAPGATER